MAKTFSSTKQLAIVQANAQILAVTGIAAFISVFSLVASQALWGQNIYLNKVTNLKQKAHVQLLANIKASDSLTDSYKTFTSGRLNAIGGLTTGTGDNDGDNAKLVLDALPSSYDFPALTSSLEQILKTRNLKIGSISGTDDEVAQQVPAASPKPLPVNMQFSLSVNTDYKSAQGLVKALQSSIRPIQIDTINLSGSSASVTLSIGAHTFYQPAKVLSITSKVVK